MYLDNLKRQHKEIAGLTLEIGRHKLVSDVESHADEIAKTLMKLAGVISMHLAAEDKYLYPALSKSEDGKVRETATKFAEEMGDLATDFTAYKTSYSIGSKIKAAPDKFLSDTKVIVGALTNRLEKEDRVLYPMVQE